MKHLSILILILSAAVFAQAQQDEPLQSPYFIDDLHCSGISKDNPEDLAYFSDEQEKAYATQAIESDNCYNLFSSYGIKKHEWYNPSDIKNFLYSLKYSGTVEDADLEIKKSELKNHVHLFLSVSQLKKTKKTIEIDARHYAANNQEDARQLYRYKFEWDHQKDLPLRNWSFGVEHLTTNADSVYQIDPGSLTAHESELFAKEAFDLTDIYLKSYNMLSGLRLDYRADLYFHNNNERRAFDSASTFAIDLGNESFRGPLGNTYIGIGLLNGNFDSYEFNNDGEQEKLSVTYAGIKMNSEIGNSRGRYAFFDAQAFQSVDGPNSSFYKIGFESGWTQKAIGDQMIFEMSIDQYVNAQLPHQRLLLTDYGTTDLAIGAKKYTRFGDFTLKLGYESISAERGASKADDSLLTSAEYIDLGFVNSVHGYDISLGVRLANQRTF